MSLFEVRISGNPSFGVSRVIANTLTHLNEHYLDGKRDALAIVVDYLDRALWFVKGRVLSELDQNMVAITLTPSEDLSERQRLAFVHAAFHAFEDVIGDLNDLSYIKIIQCKESFIHYKLAHAPT